MLGKSTRRRLRRRVAVVAALAAASAAALGGAVPASATINKEEFLPFADCPLETAVDCLYSTTTGGEFKIDLQAVPITKTIVLQGGLPTTSFTEQSLIGAADGNTLSHTPLEVPGGLLGVANIGGEVTATAELAGPASSVKVNKGNLLAQSGTAITLPIKVKLDNPLLGEDCYVGSDEEPIVLHLTTGTTNPPFPGSPITGSRGTLEGKAKGKIIAAKGSTLVDNTFSVPGAKGCGGALEPVIDLAVDVKVGIPAGPGFNTAIMSGGFEETLAEFAKKYLPKKRR